MFLSKKKVFIIKTRSYGSVFRQISHLWGERKGWHLMPPTNEKFNYKSSNASRLPAKFSLASCWQKIYNYRQTYFWYNFNLLWYKKGKFYALSWNLESQFYIQPDEFYFANLRLKLKITLFSLNYCDCDSISSPFSRRPRAGTSALLKYN